MFTKRNLILLLITGFGLIILGSGSWGLTESSEARYAEISREMLLSKDYLHPTLLGIKHYHKPPITYYMTTLGYRIFGINEFGARFFLSVALLIQLILVYKIGNLLFRDKKAAVASAIIYLSMPLVLVSTRNLTTDAYLTLFMIWAVFFILNYWKKGKIRDLYWFYIMVGIGVLTKGPAMLLPIGLFFFTWKIFKKAPIKITRHSFLAGSLALLISSSWFVAVMMQDPKVLQYFINEQIIHRATGAGDMHRSKPFWYYFLFAPLVGFPWFPFIMGMFYKNKFRLSEKYMEIKVLSVTALLILITYSSVSSKLIMYVLPMYPFMALIGGYLYVNASEKWLKWIRISLIIYGTLLMFTIILLNFIPAFNINMPLSILLTVGFLGSMLLIVKSSKIVKAEQGLLLSIVITLGMVLAFTLFASHNPLQIKTYKDIVTYAKSEKENGIDYFITYNMLLPSVAFYLDQEVITMVDNTEKVKRETQFQHDETYKSTLIDLTNKKEQQQLLQLLKNKNNVFLFQIKDSIPQVIKEPIKMLSHSKKIGKYILYY